MGTKTVPGGYLEGQICLEKGPKGPFSVKFGSLLVLLCLKRALLCLKWAKVCSKGPERPQRGSKQPQNASKWFKMAQNGSQ